MLKKNLKTEVLLLAIGSLILTAAIIFLLTSLWALILKINVAFNPDLIQQEKIATFNINQIEEIEFLKNKLGT